MLSSLRSVLHLDAPPGSPGTAEQVGRSGKEQGCISLDAVHIVAQNENPCKHKQHQLASQTRGMRGFIRFPRRDPCPRLILCLTLTWRALGLGSPSKYLLVRVPAAQERPP